jgi:2-iminobutanoate/2-iminopropanoate deaminase
MTQVASQSHGPYSPIRQAGSLFFVSGQIGVDPQTKSNQPSVEEQTKQALENLSATLATAGLSLTSVVKTTIFLTDMSDYAAVNAVYADFFEAPRPARSAVGVQELPRVGTQGSVVL